MESIRNQRYELRVSATTALSALQQFELRLVDALEKIRESLGLDKDTQPEQIAEAVQKRSALAENQADLLCKVQVVTTENGLGSLPVVDGARALAGRAKVALQDQRALKERNDELSRQLTEMAQKIVRDEVSVQRSLQAEQALVEKMRDWEDATYEAREDAKRLRGLLEEQRVRANELERKLELYHRRFANTAQPAPKMWERVPNMQIGKLHCWRRDGIHRWCYGEFNNPYYLGVPGYSGEEALALVKEGIAR